jgi:hypothetical protein
MRPIEIGTPNDGRLAVCRIAACGGIFGAVITLVGLLAFAFVLIDGAPIGHLTLTVNLAIGSSGIAMMWLANRLGARRPQVQPTPGRVGLRLVSEETPRRSAA